MRQIYKVDAMQCVTSETHPEGLYDKVSGFPKTFDSRNYPAADGNPNGDPETAYSKAKAEFLRQQAAFLDSDAPTRKLWTVTFERSDGKQMMPPESAGEFPDMTPTEAEEA